MKFGNKKITGLSPENHQNGRQKITRVAPENHQNGRQKITRVAPENHQNERQKITWVAPEKQQNYRQKYIYNGPKMVQNLLQKWYKLGSKIMNNAIPSGSELFRVFLMEKWVVRASGAHHLPHAARKRLFLFLASSIWGCGHETMARASRKKFLWKELFFKATGRLRPAFKKSSFPWNIERIKKRFKMHRNAVESS